MAQELLTTFESEIASVTLEPGTGGIFEVTVDGRPAWSRAENGGFPDIKELKRIVRDLAVPGKDLGHSER